MQETRMTLSIADLLEKKKMSQTALATRIGKSRGYVSEIIAGKKRPSMAVLEQIAEALDVPQAALFTTQPATGMSENGVEPYEARPKGDLRAAARLAGIDRASLMLYRVQRPYPGFSLLSHDILIVDTQTPGTEAGIVVVTLSDPDTGSAETTLRRMVSPWLIPDDPGASPERIQSNSQRQGLLGTVAGVLRNSLP